MAACTVAVLRCQRRQSASISEALARIISSSRQSHRTPSTVPSQGPAHLHHLTLLPSRTSARTAETQSEHAETQHAAVLIQLHSISVTQGMRMPMTCLPVTLFSKTQFSFSLLLLLLLKHPTVEPCGEVMKLCDCLPRFQGFLDHSVCS